MIPRARVRRAAWVVLLAACSCQGRSCGSSSPSGASSAQPAEEPAVEIGPASDTAITAAARQQAVLDVLAGGAPATRLPIVAVDPGVAFDANLIDKLAPHAAVSSLPSPRPKPVAPRF